MTILRRFSGSIASRVLALLVVALVFPLALNVVQLARELRSAEARIQAETQNVATNSANSVANLVEDFVGAAQVIERPPAFWEGTDQDRDQLLNFIGAAHPGIATLRFYTNDLEQHGSSHSASQMGNRESAANSDFARQATATGSIAFTSTPVLDSGIGLSVLPIAIPVREASPTARTGVFVGSIRTRRLPELWKQSLLPSRTSILLADRDSGRILVGDKGEVPEEPSIQPLALENIRAGTMTYRDTTEAGEECLMLWAAVPNSPWVILIGTPVADVFGEVRSAATARVVTALLAMTLIAGVLLFSSRKVTQRLGILRQAADRWGREDWRHRTGISGTDEIGMLARSFDHMASLVETISHALSERDNDQERTLRRRLSLLQVARQAAVAVDQDQILDVIYAEARNGIAGDVAVIGLWNESRGELLPIRHNLRPPVQPMRIPPGQGAAGRAILTRASVNMNNYQEQVARETSLRQSGVQQAIATPMLHEGELLGSLFVGRNDPYAPFNSEDLEFLEMLASIASAELIGYQRTRFAGALLAARTAEHELNNSLTRVIGFSQLLAAAAKDSDELRELCELVLDGANEAVAVVHQLRQITHIEETEWGAGVGTTIDLERSNEVANEGSTDR